MDGRPFTHRPSTVGRPRRLSDADIAAILHWHATHRTALQVAAQFGISPSLLRLVIRTQGRHYKQACPRSRRC
jgi:hypothetical protein